MLSIGLALASFNLIGLWTLRTLRFAASLEARSFAGSDLALFDVTHLAGIGKVRERSLRVSVPND